MSKRMAVKTIIISAVLVVFMLCFTGCYDDLPEPKIKYGEFPFVLTYEVDGEIRVIEDTIVCEYEGLTYTLTFKDKLPKEK